MYFPADMSPEEVEQFEYEINRIIDIEQGEGQFWAENAECQIVAEEQRAALLAEQELDCFGV